jgi:hypothetical protein
MAQTEEWEGGRNLQYIVFFCPAAWFENGFKLQGLRSFDWSNAMNG